MSTIQKYNLPQIPPCKVYYSETSNPENDVVLKCLEPNAKVTNEEENILKEAIDFYIKLLEKLKTIPLSALTLEEAGDLIKYLNEAFTMSFPIGNDLHIEKVHRVSVIEDRFLEKGKVRHPKWLTYPPLEVIRKINKYGRGNSFNTTGFYAAFTENVAIRERGPVKGNKIIISIWEPKTAGPFNSYPITNSEINNEEVRKATLAFKQKIAELHPSLAKIMDLNIGFLASEFIKDWPITNPNRLEYLFSAYFAEQTLREGPPELGMQNLDLIIYPSVAFKHKEPNILMTPTCVERRMKIVYAAEYEVEEIYLESSDEFPAKLKFIREATWFEKDQIIWEDD